RPPFAVMSRIRFFGCDLSPAVQPNTPVAAMYLARDLGEDLVLVEAEEPFLIAPDLVDVHTCVAGVCVLLDLVEVDLWVGAAGDRLGHLVLREGRGRLLEVLGERQLLREVALEARVRPHLVRRPLRLLLALCPA